MQTNDTKKIKSALNKKILLITVLLLFIAVVSACLILWPKGQKIVIGNKSYSVKVAKTQAERLKGLSGTSSLANDSAMLFDFGQSGDWQIWMKDMNYPIDILWTDNNGTVLGTKQNATPQSYPEVFSINKPSYYVIELNNGEIAKQNIANGTKIKIRL